MLRDNSIKSKILKKVENNIQKYNLIESNDKVLVAVSGGSDSMCLLYTLLLLREKLNFQVEVAHIHHMLRKESDEEAKEVENFCIKNNIKFHLGKFDINNIALEEKQSTELAARKVRYAFFNKIAKENNIKRIAIAHNIDDNAETILMHFMRGASLKGLSGIQYINGNLIRPLLNVKKRDINKFCEECNIYYAVDKTNFEMIYTRNKIRLDLIKRIEEFNPNFVDSISKMSEIIKEDNEYLELESEKVLKKVTIENQECGILFNRKLLKEYHNALINRVIIKLIQKTTLECNNIERVHVMNINNIVINGVTGKKFIIANKYVFENLSKEKAIIKKIS